MNIEMLDHDDFRKLVEDAVLTAVAGMNPPLPVQIDNVKFNQPGSGKWVSLVIKSGEAQVKSIGQNFVERTPGFVQIDIMWPKDGGHAEPKRIAHLLADSLAYRKKSYGTVTTANFWKKIVDSAPVTDPYYRVMARVFFWYDGFVTRPAYGT